MKKYNVRKSRSIGKKAAVEYFNSGKWGTLSDENIFRMQLYTKELMVPFGRFHSAAEVVLGREVYTNEFANLDTIKAEYEKKKGKPTFDEIVGELPDGLEVVMIVSQEEN